MVFKDQTLVLIFSLNVRTTIREKLLLRMLGP